MVGVLKWLAGQPNFSCFTHTRVISVEEKGGRDFGHRFQRRSRQDRGRLYDYLQKCSGSDLRTSPEIERRGPDGIHADVLHCHSHFRKALWKIV